MTARAWLPAFLLGLAVGLGGYVGAARPAWLATRWCELRLGARPRADGLAIVVSEAPPELRGPGPGPWLLLELANVGEAPLTVWMIRPAGEELELVGRGPDGAPLAPVSHVPDPERPTVARPMAQVALRPGARAGQVLDASAWLVPVAGRCTFQVVRLGFPGLDEDPVRSGEVTVDVPAS